MGPLANARRLDAMESFVKDAKSRGGKVVTGGKRHGNQGYFFEPTVITDVPDDSKIMTEEPFGPVAPIVHVQDLRRSGRARQFAAVRACGLRLHHVGADRERDRRCACSPAWSASTASPISTPETPFGGIKESGYGHEGGIEGLEAYHEHEVHLADVEHAQRARARCSHPFVPAKARESGGPGAILRRRRLRRDRRARNAVRAGGARGAWRRGRRAHRRRRGPAA